MAAFIPDAKIPVHDYVESTTYNRCYDCGRGQASPYHAPFCVDCQSRHLYGAHTVDPICAVCQTRHPDGQHTLLTPYCTRCVTTHQWGNHLPEHLLPTDIPREVPLKFTPEQWSLYRLYPQDDGHLFSQFGTYCTTCLGLHSIKAPCWTFRPGSHSGTVKRTNIPWRMLSAAPPPRTIPTFDAGFTQPTPTPTTSHSRPTPSLLKCAESKATTPPPRLFVSSEAQTTPPPPARTFASNATQTLPPPPPPYVNPHKRKLDEVEYDYEEVATIRKPIAALPHRALPPPPRPDDALCRAPAPPIPHATRPAIPVTTPPTTPPPAPQPVVAPTPIDIKRRFDDVLKRLNVCRALPPLSRPKSGSLTPAPTTPSPPPSKSSPQDFARVLARLTALHREASPPATPPLTPPAPPAYTAPPRRGHTPDAKPTSIGAIHTTGPDYPPRPFSFSFSQDSVFIKVTVSV